MNQETANIRNKISVREDEAAVLLSVSSKTLSRWRADGQGPPCFQRGKLWFYPVKTIEVWAESQAV